MKKVYIIGIGMGNPETITVEGRKYIAGSDLLIGARRMVESFAGERFSGDRKLFFEILADRIAQVLYREEFEQAAVLMSGDVGFYSGAKKLIPLLESSAVCGEDGAICGDGGVTDGEGREQRWCSVECVPGVSSVQHFCARLCTPWEDVKLVSLHGRSGDPIAAVRANGRTFFLTGSDNKAEEICRRLAMDGLGNAKVAVGQRLSYPEERIVRGTAEELAGLEFDSLAVMLVERPNDLMDDLSDELPDDRPKGLSENHIAQRQERTRETFGYEDELFVRGDVPMTKAEVRSVVLGKLKLRESDTVYDIGAGTGSVSVEMALAARCGQVYAVEVNPEGASLIRKNGEKFGVSNLHVVEGKAPEALEPLPSPDAAFLGGTKGNMDSIIKVLVEKNPQVRIVVNAIALETVAEALQCLKDNGFSQVEAITVTVAKAREVGRYHMMMGQNPIYIITAQR